MKKSGSHREPPGCQYPLGLPQPATKRRPPRPFPHICRDSRPSTAKVATGLLESNSRPNARITALENMCRSASQVGGVYPIFPILDKKNRHGVLNLAVSVS